MAFARREVLAGTAAGLTLHGARIEATTAPGGSVRVEEGTNIALTVSPDGQAIAIDLYGVLWRLPASGGRLQRLTGDDDDIGQPQWSPDGQKIAMQSYRDGNFRIWAVPANEGPMQRMTPAGGLHDEREPCWSPDGRMLAFSSDSEEGRYAIHILDVASGAARMFSPGSGEHSEPAWSPDGRTIAFVEDGSRIVLMPLAGGAARTVAAIAGSTDPFHPKALRAPAFAPDGMLHYSRLDDHGVTLVAGERDVIVGEDLYPFRPAWTRTGLLYAAGGKIRHRTAAATRSVPFETEIAIPHAERPRRSTLPTGERSVRGIVAPALSPDGRRVVFGALNDLWLMTIGRSPERLVSGDFHKADPAWSPDGRQIAYAADRRGTMDIWVHDLATGCDRQVTFLPAQAAAAPAWSPDGEALAFLDQDGVVHRLDLASGEVRRLYGPLWQPGRPSFGPGGRTIALAAFKPVSKRFREGLSEVLTIDLATGEGSYAPIAPGKSLATRGLDGPVWSPDGLCMAYVFASTLWVVRVDDQGRFTDAPRQVSGDVADAPSWAGDSNRILYLSNGRLRIVDISGGPTRTLPCALSWAEPKRSKRTIVSVGRLWDGTGNRYRPPCDIVIEGEKIVALAPRGSTTGEVSVRVDGSGLTALPGLVDMHTHRQMQGFGYGDRMGRLLLAMGITATRSPGAPAYHMVEDREAIASGARIAPRHYATGEALDGSRVFYNFMRPVTEPGQLQLELSRARALSYDLIKTYVRLRHDVQAQVAAAARSIAIPVTSHYHYPAVVRGIEGVEHMGASSRYGYSRTMSAQGGGYEDVTTLLAAARTARTPTLFASNVLLREDDSFARDRRIRALMPTWEQEKLAERIKAMREHDPAPLLRSLANQVRQIRDQMAAGWHVVAGTDAPIDFVAISLHLNLRAMVRFGISPAEALKTATSHAGSALDAPLGSLRAGMLADLILVDGDPLTHIEDAAKVHHIFAQGRHHTPESLIGHFSGTGAPTKPHQAAASTPKSTFYWEVGSYLAACRGRCCQDL